MRGGIPLGKISVTNIVLVAILVAAAIALSIVGNTELANTMGGAAVGVVFGSAATTVVVQQSAARNGAAVDTDKVLP
jgi:hypothetical protein